MSKTSKVLAIIAIISLGFNYIQYISRNDYSYNSYNKNSYNGYSYSYYKSSNNNSGYSLGTLYFANCSEAKAKGYYNIRKGSPGYRPALDRDGDGIACEY